MNPMPDYYPEEHPEAQWLWPWDQTLTRDLFTKLGAAVGFAPGPEGLAWYKYIIKSDYQLDTPTARRFINDLGNIIGQPPLDSV